MNKKILIILGFVLLGTVYFVFIDNETNTTTDSDKVTEVQTAQEENEMTFFVTSINPGTGANYGGLQGADQHCQALADNVGAGDNVWRAYLSAAATESTAVVNARDRIGTGPWQNANGVLIASSVADLHDTNAVNINKQTAVSENGSEINGRGDSPNVHDILTGSNPDGTLAIAEGDTTCSNWTSEGEGSAIVGHHDRQGLDESESAKSWNSSHGSRGCSLENLNSTGGGGLLYCFAQG